MKMDNKMEKRILRWAASFMITLVIMLPIYVSDVSALTTLSVDRFSGNDDVTGYVRGDYDELTIEILTAISDQIRPISKNQLDVQVEGLPSPYLFDNCVEEGAGTKIYRCTYVKDGTFRGIKSYTVNLYEEGSANTVLKSVTQTLTADSYGAEIVEMTVEPELTNTGQITVSFDAEDYSVDRGDTSACSGFDKIEFYLGDVHGNVIQTILPSSGCTFTDTFTYTIPTSVSGQTQVCGKAFDLLGQSGQARCRPVTVDRDAPEATSGSVRVTYNGEDLLYVNPRATVPILATVSVIVNAEDLKSDSVTADFSAITDSPGFDNKPYSRFSVSGPGEIAYFWENVPIELVSSCLITVKGEDNAENQMNTQVFCSVSPDVQAPAVLDIIPLFESDNGVPYISAAEGELSVAFREEGGGMDKSKIYLDLTNVNGRNKVRAKTCEHEDGTNRWTCDWEDIDPQAGDGEYPVSIWGGDMLGNEMTQAYAFDMGIDTIAPILDEDNVEFNSYHTTIDYGDVTVNGDVIEIIIPVTGFDSAFADCSSVGGPDVVAPDGYFTNENGTFALFTCIVDASGPYTANVGFEFYDFSGNKVETTYDFVVSGIDNDTNPDHWGIESIICSPSSIDRSITQLLPGGVKSFCKVQLDPKGNVEITAIGLGDISECTGDIPDYITDINIMMNTPGTEEVYLVATLGSAKVNKDTLEFSCPLYMMSKVTAPDGAYYTENIEVEMVTKELMFYDMPLGEPGQRIKDKIKEADDASKIAGNWMDDFQTFFYWYETVCNFVQMITNALAAIKAASFLLGAASQVPGVGSSLEGAWVIVCEGSDWMVTGWKNLNDNFFDYACSLATCSYSKKWLKYAVGVEFGESFNVKKSLIWSTIGLCIPGVLRGVGKWRQLECQRAICYTSQVASGMKVYECDASYSFSICKYVLGEIFNAIPFVQVFSNYAGMVEGYISNPGELTGWALTQVFDLLDWCEDTMECSKTYTISKIGCDLVATLSAVGKVIEDVKAVEELNMGDWVPPESMCRQWEDVKDEARAEELGII